MDTNLIGLLVNDTLQPCRIGVSLIRLPSSALSAEITARSQQDVRYSVSPIRRL